MMRQLPKGHVIVACAPNGARRTKADHPALPIQPEELADCAQQIAAAGASVLHLHVRDDAGAHSLDAGRYREAIAAIRARIGEDLIIQITTEAVGMYSPAVQMQTVRDVRPEAASCALRELCPDAASQGAYGAFLAECEEQDVWVQHILYDARDSERFIALRRAGIIADPSPFVLLVLGRYGGGDSRPSELAARAAPFVGGGDVAWAVCAFGASEHDAALEAVALGGHARLGFENNLSAPDGAPARSNAEQIARFTAALPKLGARAAHAQEIRAALGL